MIAAPTPRTGRTSARARDAAATVQCRARRAREGFASLPGRGIADRRAGLEGAETPPPHVGGARYVQIWAGSAYVGQGPISPRLGLACLSLHLPLRIFIASSPSPSSRPSSFSPRKLLSKWLPVDASTVVASVTRRRTAPRPAPLPATTADRRDTSRETAPPRPRRRPATSVARRATFPGTARRTLRRPAPLVAATSPPLAAAATPVRSATGVARPATLRAHVLRLPAVPPVAASAAEATAASAVVSKGLATLAVA